MNEKQLWDKFLETIKEKITPISYETWFKDTYLNKIEENKIIAVVPMQLHKKNLSENYKDVIAETINEITGTNFEFEFLLEDEVNKNNKIFIEEQGVPFNNPEQANLNSNYTFDNFVVGTSNRFTSDKFISDFIGINRKNNNNYDNIDYFKNKYRNIDVLIIDDIQFLANATQSQQEFFHTFNELHQEGKQIIISSDRSPEDLKLLEERLRTRFSWGLTVNIYPPDYDLRMQILKKKLSVHELAKPIEEDVLEYIANNCTSDVRKLEGALNRLFAYTTMFNKEKINLEVATEALKGHLNSYGYIKNDIQKIQSVVADYYKINVEDMKSKKRTNNIAFPRQIAMYLSRILTDESLTRIGLEFGGKDHTTIIHAFDKIDKEIKNDSNLEQVINNIKNKLK